LDRDAGIEGGRDGPRVLSGGKPALVLVSIIVEREEPESRGWACSKSKSIDGSIERLRILLIIGGSSVKFRCVGVVGL
jgi:hypothetical protein